MGGYEPTTKVLSVVNSVEMEGVEKYLVVRFTCSQYSHVTHLLPAPRVWIKVRERDITE